MKRVKVCVTGAAGNIAYALIFRLASGEAFGKETSIDLRLLDIEPKKTVLESLEMELNDCKFPLIESVLVTSDAKTAFKDVDWALLVGAFPRGPGMDRKDLIGKNTAIFSEQGKALNEAASKDAKVLVVGNPCNTNAYVVKSCAKNLNPKNIFAMTYLDENRARFQIAKKAGASIEDVKKTAVWGNHSKTMFPNYFEATVNGKKATEICGEAWLKSEFLPTVRDRGAKVIEKRGLSSAASAASAALDTVKALVNPTPEGDYFSASVESDGSYGVEKGLIFSYPLVSDGKSYKIVQGINLNDEAKAALKAAEDELKQEILDAKGFMS